MSKWEMGCLPRSEPRPRYLKANETPGWMDHTVVDLDSGKQVPFVKEVNEDEGWAVIYETDAAGRIIHVGHSPVVKRITGRFMIERVKG